MHTHNTHSHTCLACLTPLVEEKHLCDDCLHATPTQRRRAFEKTKHKIAFFYIVLFATLFYQSHEKLHNNLQTASFGYENLFFEPLIDEPSKLYGIDISHYQGQVKWDKINTINDSMPISFVFMRATVGKDNEDTEFKKNWEEAGKIGMIKGAYHYYRPYEHPHAQAHNFIKHVKLQKGDFPPILDIESKSKKKSMKVLKSELKKWLHIVERHYKVKPIIYTSASYYKSYLKDDFKEYTFWLANYNNVTQPVKDENWLFWQYSCTGRISGIQGDVDLNIFNGTRNDFEYYIIK